MANEIKYQDVVATLEKEVGYQGQHYNSKFTEYLDSINWYAQKKAGACTWCCILNDYAIAVNRKNLSVDQARAIACEPKENYGAGVKEKAQYFKDRGRWISAKDYKKATTGDQIFLNGYKHTGTIVGWEGSYFFYIDGSTTYDGKPNSVGKKKLSMTASKIDGFGRPDWYKFQTPDVEEPKPEPTPEPSPENPNKTIDQLANEVIEGKWGNGKERAEKLTAAGYNYQEVQNRVNEILGVGKSSGQPYKVVNVNSFLRIRSAPSLEGQIIGRLNNGDKVTVYKTSGNWAKISKDQEQWCSMDYLKKV